MTTKRARAAGIEGCQALYYYRVGYRVDIQTSPSALRIAMLLSERYGGFAHQRARYERLSHGS